MVPQKTWWYSRINEVRRGLLLVQGTERMKTEERMELRAMLEETLRLVDDLARKR